MPVALAIALILWALGWLLGRSLREPQSPPSAGSPVERLSLIIPARNEAHNLPRLLDSIFAQNLPPWEVIVVDDQSDDGTAEIANAHGVRVIASAPLPESWCGKTWACHQGAQAATGSHLCFLDADTWFEPDGLKSLLDYYRGGACSLAPWHRIDAAYESLSLFFNLAMVAGTAPHGLFGQLLLIDRDSYQRAGGHQAVKGKVLENVFMAGHFASHGIPTHSASGRGIVSFRMYPSGIRELIEGWTKGFASGAGATSKLTLWTMVAWMSGLMIPCLMPVLSNEWAPWFGMYLLCAVQVRILSRKVGSFGWLAALGYPLALLFFFAVFFQSARKRGTHVTWKGRRIHAS